MEDKLLEEAILEILISEARLKDPETEFEIHTKLSQKYQNFYESWLPPRSVERKIEDIKRLIEKLRSFNSRCLSNEH